MKFLVLALSLVGLTTTANASIFAEPYLGYGLGKFENGSTKGTMNGAVLGGRVGGEMAMLFIGGDYSMSLDGESKTDGSSTTQDFDSSQLYGVIGANLPLLRLWAGYGLMNQVTLKTALGDSKTSGGTHVKLGLGIKVVPMVSLNLEYLISDYKEVEFLGTKNDSDLKTNTVLLSASIPLSF